MPLFAHRFTPAAASARGASINLTVEEVEDAVLREVLQTPGVAIGKWDLLGALLQPGSPDFLFATSLGQAHEVKTGSRDCSAGSWRGPMQRAPLATRASPT